jgi:hypothetical protein
MTTYGYEEDKKILAGNIHSANLAASGHGKREQIVFAAERTLDVAREFEAEAFLIGDSNYPFLAKKMLRAVKETGLQHVDPRSGASTYTRGPIGGQYDRAWVTSGLLTDGLSVLPPTPSDHRAVLLKARHSK